jgi:hypothetical protein
VATGTTASQQSAAGLRRDAIGLREVLFQSITDMAPGMPERYLRQAAFGGLHDHLRELAASL